MSVTEETDSLHVDNVSRDDDVAIERSDVQIDNVIGPINYVLPLCIFGFILEGPVTPEGDEGVVFWRQFRYADVPIITHQSPFDVRDANALDTIKQNAEAPSSAVSAASDIAQKCALRPTKKDDKPHLSALIILSYTMLGVCVAQSVGKMKMSCYAKKEEIIDVLNKSFNEYATKDDIKEALAISLGECATKDDIKALNISLGEYATKDNIKEALDISLGECATKDDIKALNISLGEYATKDEIKEANISLGECATKDDIKALNISLGEYATKDDIKEALAISLAECATKDDIKALNISLGEYATKDDIKEDLDISLGAYKAKDEQASFDFERISQSSKVVNMTDLGWVSLSKEKKTWADARASCLASGGRLIEGLKRNHFQSLWDHFRDDDDYNEFAYVGIYNETWLSSGEKVDPNLYHNNQPDGSSQFCGYFHLKKTCLGLGDRTCEFINYFLCQYQI
ncbi:uncharacterized protein [Palaemon carinicauda]|uniref:uncharacterized protein n=1 Tax=Palaemon carinicauda TaxID=392227 RepID=UPI0035B59B89